MDASGKAGANTGILGPISAARFAGPRGTRWNESSPCDNGLQSAERPTDRFVGKPTRICPAAKAARIAPGQPQAGLDVSRVVRRPDAAHWRLSVVAQCMPVSPSLTRAVNSGSITWGWSDGSTGGIPTACPPFFSSGPITGVGHVSKSVSSCASDLPNDTTELQRLRTLAFQAVSVFQQVASDFEDLAQSVGEARRRRRLQPDPWRDEPPQAICDYVQAHQRYDLLHAYLGREERDTVTRFVTAICTFVKLWKALAESFERNDFVSRVTKEARSIPGYDPSQEPEFRQHVAHRLTQVAFSPEGLSDLSDQAIALSDVYRNLESRIRAKIEGKKQVQPRGKGKRGRPTDTDLKEDKRISDAWKTGAHPTYEACGHALGMTGEHIGRRVREAVDRQRKRHPNRRKNLRR